MKQLIEEFLKVGGLKHRKFSPATKKVYETTLLAVDKYIGARKWTKELLSKWEATLTTSAATINLHLHAIRSFLRWCLYDKGMDVLNPMEIITRGNVRRPKIDPLTMDEFYQMVDCIDSPRDKAILWLLFSTGLRVAELVALDRDKLSPRMSIIGKGNKPRNIFVQKNALEICNIYLGQRVDDDKAMFVAYSNDPDVGWKRISVRRIQDIVSNAAARAGITKKVTPHTLRHTYATDLVNNGADISAVQALLGHGSINTTQIYVHISSERMGEVHSKYQSSR